MIKQSIEIVIPAYNEEKNIQIVVKKSLKWLKSQTKDYVVSVVDDGSTDNTVKVLTDLQKKNKKHLKIICHPRNLGIGQAWYTLYENSSKDIIFSCPADQQFDPNDFSKALPYVDKADIISIYRPKKEDYDFFRLFITNIHRLLIKLFFNLEIKDINWVKMFKKWTLKELDLKSKSVLLDTEILAKAKKRKAKIIQVSAPSHLRIYGKSGGSNFKQLSSVFIELINVYLIVKIFK